MSVDIKLIAFDIDGTTINSFRKVSTSTLEMLVSLHERGYILVPTTGRSLDGIPKAIKDLDVCDYAISSNGSRITNLRTGECLGEILIPQEKAQKIVKIAKKHRVALSVHANNQCYDTTYFQQFVRYHLFHNDFIKNPVTRDMSQFIADEGIAVEKIQLFSAFKFKLKRLLNELESVEGIAYPMSAKNYYEITAVGADKGSTLTTLCNKLNIDLGNVLAIGDDSNDIPMLKVAGVSVAMGNAKERVREHADYVTTSNNKHGFAEAMKKRLLKQ